MTRDGDQYVDLDDRVAIARKANASLFISVHADTLSEDTNVSGSTVYTVADRASDAEAARIAARENAAGRRPGAAVGRIIRTWRTFFSISSVEKLGLTPTFSREALSTTCKAATRLNHNPERSAGFVVLKAPEFPSVLVELGYLSNAQDVQSLSSPEWRAKTAAAMVRDIDAFFRRPRKAGQRSIGREWRRLVGCSGRRALSALRLARNGRSGLMACEFWRERRRS